MARVVVPSFPREIGTGQNALIGDSRRETGITVPVDVPVDRSLLGVDII